MIVFSADGDGPKIGGWDFGITFFGEPLCDKNEAAKLANGVEGTGVGLDETTGDTAGMLVGFLGGGF